ncbi:MBL fold metallo-hydrolase [Limnobacter humi]|uniref:MBL fold metallo-hydrolase n=1 Tax=Limnobacter humi TaxID=1778671 RepID=A0ABT1WG24_9BURK|nr:alkyl sulfatase dimerization domain-containing protein [Limnobacter humi]MCQ8896470.1 MBL fold metallo-hydrolase [Limnobacter humi]
MKAPMSPVTTPIGRFAQHTLPLGLLLALAACSKTPSTAVDTHSAASATVQTVNADVAKLPFMDQNQSLEDAQRGLVAKPTGQIKNAAGKVIWDFDAFNFLQGPAPSTVNPSLWKQAIQNNQVGLFKVVDGIYQLRGFDLANMTLIEGKTGWIVVDTLTSEETARYAIDFARKHLGNKPITGIVFTHSHIDHFGGVLGLVSAKEVKERNIPVVAPEGFMEEATSENVLVGPAMARRSIYMYGNTLPRSAEGLVDNGLGKAVAYGTVGILPPTVLVKGKAQTVSLDGLDFEFHNVPGSEAPAEFVFYLPQYKAFGAAELFGHTLHNLYTLRGAKVRDALKWSNYMNDAMQYAADAEVSFHQHNWPVWGKANIANFMEKQRDTYKFLHDQTVHQLNQGLTASEISEAVKLPKSLNEFMSTRGYYGTVSHNVKAVYQFYMGWYDANPANLNPLPPVEQAKRYVALAGGESNVLKAAQAAYDKGEYRWSAELLKHAVYANPDSKPARELQAQCFEQMGYMAESGPWRNVYLTGAKELRQGAPKDAIKRNQLLNMLEQTPVERFLEAMSAAVNAEKAEGEDLTINLSFSDTGENYVLHIKNSVLHHTLAPRSKEAAGTLVLTKPFFLQMMIGEAGAKDLLLSDQTKIEGSTLKVGKFFGMLDKAEGNFNIVTP